MKKRVLSLLLVLLMVVSLVPTMALADDTDNVIDSGYCGGEGDGTNLTWTLYKNGTLEISGTGAMASWTWARRGSSYNTTAPWSDYVGSQINSVVINEGVTSIGNCAFYDRDGTSLTRIVVPKSVTSIGDYVFYGCTKLTSITIPNSVTNIGKYTFSGCTSLTSVEIPNGVEIIHGGVFDGCTGLMNVKIPDSVIKIYAYAFRNCTGLTSVTLPENLQYLTRESFDGCSNLESVWIPKTITNKTSDDGWENYAKGPFAGCSSLKTVEFADGITNIPDGLFAGCNGIESIEIPDTVTEILDHAFKNCSNLTSITIPNSVANIGTQAFYGCTSIVNVAIPNSVTRIEDSVFWGCKNLASIGISNSVISIGRGAFSSCTSLTSVEIPNSVTSIEGWAFSNCTSLKSIAIPNIVTNIGSNAFDGCTGLISADIQSRTISTNAFEGCTSLKSVDIKASESIGNYAFKDCPNIETVNIKSCSTIGEYAFQGCAKLKSLTLPTDLKTIGQFAFKDCNSLETLNIPSVETIAASAFSGCTGLTSVSLPKNVKTIGNAAFRYCDNIKDVYYAGSETEWKTIDIQPYNEPITNATIHYAGETHTHNYKAVVTAPTCTEKGYTTHTCSCGDSYVDSYTNALGHDYKNGECTRCHAKDPNQTHTHDYKSTVTAPTCTSAGYTTYTCTGCGHSYKDNYKDALGHDYKNGECTRCHAKDPNHTHTHDYKSTVTKPTCTEKGYTTHTCSCGDSYKDSYKDALGHLYIFGKCIRCGEKEDSSETHKHDYKSRVVEPTCTEGGYTLLECECGKSYETLHTKALGHEYKDGLCLRCGAKDPNAHTHKYVETVTKPTCTEKGYTTYTCSVCNDSYKGSYTDSLGHSYVGGVCTRCGAKDPNYKPAVSFIDVPSDAFYANAVKWAVENEITTGVGNNRFDPNGQCTRGQVVTFLWRAAGKPTVSANVSFSDVQPGAFYYEAVKWAVANGITTGVGGNRFAPNDTCTRGQVVTFLHRAENSPAASTISSFTDVPSTAFYYNAVNWAVTNGITNGTGNGRFSPNDTCTRAQVVTFLYRAQ